MLTNLDFSLKAGETRYFSFFGRFVVNVHCSLNVSMPHNLLNDFQVRLILAKPCAECMSKIVDAEMRQHNGFSALLLCPLCFVQIAVSDNSLDCPVDYMGR